MYLKSIELSGFKSFAKKSELTFTSRISAIVGPNGSGKSNVAEAFRFVLGEQSLKSLRGKKGEDLIFNGAGGEARANRASVKVVFDNQSAGDGRAFPIDFPEVTLERVVHRDGANDYFLNGSQVRLKDILELLASANIGASGHHIISQGEADKILNASPKDRKAIIEEALGLKIYQYKRIESERKQKKTFENIREVESLRKEIAPHLRFLKKQVERVEKAEGQKAELTALSEEYFKREEAYLSREKESLKKERTMLEGELERLGKELHEAKHILERASEKGKQDFLVLDLEAKTAEARVHMDALVRELGRIEGEIAAEERVIRKEEDLRSKDEFKTVRLKEVEDFARVLDKDFDEAAALPDKESLIALIGRVRASIRDFILGRKEVFDTGVITEAKKALEELGEVKNRLEGEIRSAEETEKALQKELTMLKQEIDKEKDTSRDTEKALFRIMSEENDVRSKLGVIRVHEEKVRLEEEDFLRELEEVSRLIGSDAFLFRNHDLSDDAEGEERRIQEERKREVSRLKLRLEDSGVSGGEEVLKEFRETSERDEFLARELLDLEKSAESLKELIKELEERLRTEFNSGLERINREFNELFAAMFGGGSAELILTREKKKKVEAILEGEEVSDEEGEEILEEGLDISVNLPRKRIKGLMMLSGGERALTSIALLFAISQVNPPPFIILDETDAALDEANSKRYGDMAEKLSEKSQLILITHNRETMSRAGVIYGVTMSSTGVSKLLSIEFEEAVQVAK